MAPELLPAPHIAVVSLLCRRCQWGTHIVQPNLNVDQNVANMIPNIYVEL